MEGADLPDMHTGPLILTGVDFPDCQAGQLFGPGCDTLQGKEVESIRTTTGTTDRTTFHGSTLTIKEEFSSLFHCCPQSAATG